jgi:hypothetical protein
MTRFVLYALAAAILCACSLKRELPPNDAQATDAGVVQDDSSVLLADASSMELEDAGFEAPDSGSEAMPDAGPPDAGPPAPTCPGSSVWDDLTGYCYVRRLGDSPCTGSYAPVRWETTDEQVRLQAFLATELGGSGAVGLRRLSIGWVWVDDLSSPPSLRWATPPAAGEIYAYLAADGLRTYFRPYSYAYCRTFPV